MRQDRIGDVLVSTPLINSLKKRYPNIIIDFLLSPNNYFVLKFDSRVRKRWVYKKNLFSPFSVLYGIRREKYDFVVDLMDNPSTTSTIFCAISGARWSVGLSKENTYVYDVIVPLLSRKNVHIVERLGKLLSVFGINPDKEHFQLQYETDPSHPNFAEKYLKDYGIENYPLFGINISPAAGARFWGRKNFENFISAAIIRYPDFKYIILSQPADRKIAEQIVKQFPSVLLSPVTNTFDEFATLVQKLNILLTPDTSTVHLAAAFNIPSVVLYIQSNSDIRIWEPYGSPCETLITSFNDLSTIPPSDVLKAIERLINRNKTDSDNFNLIRTNVQ